VLGAIVAGIATTGAGAAAGGVPGGLVGLGIPEHKAKFYRDIIDKDGGLLLGVQTSSGNVGRVKDILKNAGGESLSVE